MILSSIKTGVAQMWANKRMVVIFFVVNFLFGLLLMLPLRASLSNFVGRSLMGAELAGRLDMDFLFEFLNETNITSILTSMFVVVPVFYWLISLFLSGGAFAVFTRGETYSARIFWGNAANYFGRFFRLTLWSLPILAILLSLHYIGSLVQRIIFGGDPYQYVTYWSSWIKFGLRLIGILLFGLIFDYARIYTVLTDERKMRVSLWQGIRFAFGNFGKTVSLSLLLFVVGVVVLVIYNPIANSLAAPNVFVIVLLFLVQQLYMFFRMMLRLTLYASETYLYQTLDREAVAEEASSATGELGIEGTPA
ncbi:hypothetical protein GWO43_06190 [candidate division KSB1 bacterium]|nr:hypothetical protein [candidate division KSB1 bacterium]NIR70558.1 hypothetical protein [candidate division KSB1 bacterium]NIS27704.1 hypothetical protein [candidate division KSB1 bacterium]NIT70478.1 hypothetical protein [candidate division KSB1 bacterium]NIU28357.1 hypothetical protein [candidate division KSB1 bacterium]